MSPLAPDVAGHGSVLHAAGQAKHHSADEETSDGLPEPVAEPAQDEEGAHSQGARPPTPCVGDQTSNEVTSYGHNTGHCSQMAHMLYKSDGQSKSCNIA